MPRLKVYKESAAAGRGKEDDALREAEDALEKVSGASKAHDTKFARQDGACPVSTTKPDGASSNSADKCPVSTERSVHSQSEGSRGSESHFWVKVCDFFISSSLALIFLGLPLFFTNATLQGLGFEKQMFFYIVLLAGLFAWIIKAIIEGHILIKRTPLDIPIALFLLATLISSILSVNKWTSFMGGWGIPAKSFISILSVALFYWFMISNITRKRLRIVLASVSISIGLICFISILNVFSWNLLGWLAGLIGISSPTMEAVAKSAGFNTIGLLSNLEIFISAAILILVGILGSSKFKVQSSKLAVEDEESREGRAGKERKKLDPSDERGARIGNWKLVIRNSLLYIILLACLFVILVLGSYVSLIGLLVGLGIVLTLAMSGLIEMDKKPFSVNSFLFALVLVYILVGKHPIQLKPLPSEVGLSRSLSWQISKEAFKDKYLLGVGPGNFEYAFNKYKPASFNVNALWNTRFSEATGIFYESLATLGGIGTASLILLILTYLGVCFYMVVKRGTKQGADILFVALFAASVAIGIDMAMYLTGGVLIILACLIGALVMSVISLSRPHYFKEISLSYKVKPEYALALSFVFVCLTCCMILLFVTLGKIYAADVCAKNALSSENEEIALYKINKAIGLFPYQYMYYEKLGDLMALVGDKEMQNEKRDMAKVQNLLISALNSHKKAITLAPKNAFSWENLGVLSEAIVKYDPTLLNEAENSYKKAIELDPNNPALRMRLGVIKEAKGDIALAQAAPRGNNADSNADETRKNNEEIGKKLYDEAVEYFEKAIELKPNLTSAYDGVSRIKEKQGLTTDAINYMTASYNLNANNAFYPFNLGRLYYNRAVLGDNANREESSKFKVQSSKLEEDGEGEESLKLKVESEKLEEGEEVEEGETSPQPSPAGEGASAENDLKIAEALFKRAVQLESKYVDALYSLGMVFERQGMKNEAKDYYQQTLDALPESAAEARSALEEKIGSM